MTIGVNSNALFVVSFQILNHTKEQKTIARTVE